VPEEWGEIEKRGITWEIITATALLESGADILVLRHPDAIGVIRETINRLAAQ
jgi:acetyl-CoA decarbonylase/synthase complex subunit delta